MVEKRFCFRKGWLAEGWNQANPGKSQAEPGSAKALGLSKRGIIQGHTWGYLGHPLKMDLTPPGRNPRIGHKMKLGLLLLGLGWEVTQDLFTDHYCALASSQIAPICGTKLLVYFYFNLHSKLEQLLRTNLVTEEAIPIFAWVPVSLGVHDLWVQTQDQTTAQASLVLAPPCYVSPCKIPFCISERCFSRVHTKP